MKNHAVSFFVTLFLIFIIGAGFSLESTKTAYAANPKPQTPTNLRATAILATQIDLAWSASVGAVGYRVERCINSGCSSFVVIAAPTQNTYSNTGLTPGTLYRYRVRAVNSKGLFSGYSTVLSVTTQSAPPAPTPITPKITLVSSSLSADPLIAGGIQKATATFSSATSLSGLIVDIRIYNSSNVMIDRKGFDGVNIGAGATVTLTYDYQSPLSLPPGTYTMQVGVWGSTWSPTYLYETPKTFSVVSEPIPPPTTPITVPIGTTPKITLVSSSLSTDPLIAGGIQKATATIGSATSLSGLIVNLMIYNSSSTLIGLTGPGSVNIEAGATATFTYDFVSPANLPPGIYQFRVGVWGSTWSPTYLYETPKTFSVVSGTTDPASTTESAQGTTITTTGTIVDANGARWTVVGGVVYKDGVATVSSNVTLLLYWNHTVYQQNAAGGWWGWINDGWQGTSDPRVSTPPIVTSPATIAVQYNGNTWLQTGTSSGTSWVNDGIWGAGNLTRGTYTGINGTTYEQATGISSNLGPNGEIAWRTTWAWPNGTTEVKSYPSAITGAKPGCKNTWVTPCGAEIKLPDGTFSQVYPSGATPETFFPLQLPLQPLYSSFNYFHSVAPTGQGHLSYDLWLQNTPTQCHGWNACGEITHEIMIPLTYWGNYGAHPSGRNPAWYSRDATIDGLLWHVYYVAPNTAAWPWAFIAFEPDGPLAPRTLDLAKFVNYVADQGWVNGNTWMVSSELGIEPVVGTGDLTVSNYRVWR